MKKLIALAAAALLATAAHAGCYTVLNSKGAIISQTSTPPVHMDYQLHQTVPYRYGSGARMVFGLDDEDCGPEADLYDDSWRPVKAKASARKAKKRGRKARRRVLRRRSVRRAPVAAAAAPAAQAAPATARAPAPAPRVVQ